MSAYQLSFNHWAYPTRTLDTHEMARATVERWTKLSPDGSPESLIQTFEQTLDGLLKALCDA